ncbi:LCP family protein [Streptomyces wuyuanensis]|uniref:Anionic cell wall polymer biosynthesis enzyme, LytR-Cps2A-Psr (LCP) family n=1 Tax=Streptomyces wuyuanensis TaxID=1196353 RepID=A0A1G9SGA3_9ACTN|nr:LCP family protein [Streptomyces wuyuanensis]SDM34469.1 Anionic cell wall polymer biosynthesis enzyme, LytR-Cps2A-Psr (LCP) family [Streptomyces wuyuanensis]
MNDQQNPYDPYYPQQPQIIGYDEYGQPVYQQPQHDPQAHGYDAYGRQSQDRHRSQHQPPQAPQGYGYDPYAQPQQHMQHQQQSYDPYGRQQQPHQQPRDGHGYDGYGYDTGPQAAVDTTGQWSVPPQQQPAGPPHPDARRGPAPAEPDRVAPAVPGQRRPAAGDDGDYRTEQFSFVEEPDEDSEDVIDWLKFTESRSERREEAKRRGRNRTVALVAVLALFLAGGVGYLWYAGKLPGTSDSSGAQTAASGPQKRDVIVLHLHNTKKKGTSTALLVDNATAGQGTTVLLPNSLSVADDEGVATTLGKSVDEDGTTGTRESIGTLLGTRITGTWRLDTPFLENLVELVGGIDITTDAVVPGAKKGEAPLVKKGENQTLNGRMAVAYATYRAPGEAEAKQLQRFGQVMYGVLRKMPSDARSATVTVETLAQILDPSLPEKDLGASLAKLAEHAKGGDYKTAVLPVQDDGRLSQEASDSVVKDILGGRVSAPEQGAAVRVGVRNASGDGDATESTRIVLVNGGYAFVDAGKADPEASTQVVYGDTAQKQNAVEVAKTLGLDESAVEKGKAVPNADVLVVLGQDYE